MIAFLEGTLEIKQAEFAILNVQGVGYRVEISGNTYEQLPEAGKGIRLLIHHHITDSDQRLFGFFTGQEKLLFEKLITVKGIGPRLGLTIMSGMESGELIEAIIDEDDQALSRIPGIGKKSAGRIILELKDKILEGYEGKISGGTESTSSLKEEAVSALEALGFRKREAEKVVSASVKEGVSTVSEIVKRSLNLLNR
ncbi:MAG: Holliday junction branch migration protein RuvA [Balneolaceae bacterium]